MGIRITHVSVLRAISFYCTRLRNIVILVYFLNFTVSQKREVVLKRNLHPANN